jgi:hypothetical protein
MVVIGGGGEGYGKERRKIIDIGKKWMRRVPEAWTKGTGEAREERRALHRLQCRVRSQERTVSVEDDGTFDADDEDEDSKPLSMLDETQLHAPSR